MAEISELSEREVQILQLVATGASNKEIANQLYISTNTVKVHLRNIFAKIGVASRTEAAMFAVQSGLIQPVGEEQHGLSDRLPVHENSSGMSSLSFRYVAYAIIGLLLITVTIFGVYLLRDPNTFASTQTELVTEESRWQTRSELPTARRGLAVAAYENVIYAIAGESAEGVTGITEIYQPETDTWRTGIPKPVPVVDVKAIVLGGKIYVPGGKLASDEVTNILEIYNPRTDKWELGAELPFGISAYAASGFEGKLFLFGGWGGEDYLDTVFEYDPNQDSWVELTKMPIKRAYGGAAVSGGKIYVLGGINEEGILSINHVYAPELDQVDMNPWSEAADLPEKRYAMGVTNVVDNIYIISGSSVSEKSPNSLVYLPSADSYQNIEVPISMPSSRFGLVFHGSQMYIIGGDLGDSFTDTNLSYQAIYTILIPVMSK